MGSIKIITAMQSPVDDPTTCSVDEDAKRKIYHAMMSTNNQISSLNTLTQQILRYNEEELTSHLFSSFETIAANACQDMRQKAGEFLHNLDENEHTEEHVRAVIDACPESLSYTDSDGRLPIQNAADRYGSRSCASCNAIEFIPLLAQEGKKLDVAGDKGGRGGLLTHVLCDFNVIQFLSVETRIVENTTHSDYSCNRAFERKCLQALKNLKAMGLLLKEDIYDYGLLFFAADPKAQQRFDFLTQWDPQNLKRSKQRGSDVPLIHAAIEMEDVTDAKKSFEMLLVAMSRYFPCDLGFFLSLEHKGKIACKAAIERFGQFDTMTMICRSIPGLSHDRSEG